MITLTLALAAVVAFASGDKKGERTYKVNTQESAITWKGKKVTGEHYGKLKFESGVFNVNGDDILNGAFTTDMTSITVEDMQGEYGKKLEGHLRSADFFNVEEHATASMELTEVKEGMDGNFEFIGTLTIKGISHPISFPAQVKMSDKKIAARGEFTFDRTKYDVKYGSGKFFEGLGDKTIYDDVALSFVLIAEK